MQVQKAVHSPLALYSARPKLSIALEKLDSHHSVVNVSSRVFSFSSLGRHSKFLALLYLTYRRKRPGSPCFPSSVRIRASTEQMRIGRAQENKGGRGGRGGRRRARVGLRGRGEQGRAGQGRAGQPGLGLAGRAGGHLQQPRYYLDAPAWFWESCHLQAGSTEYRVQSASRPTPPQTKPGSVLAVTRPLARSLLQATHYTERLEAQEKQTRHIGDMSP